MKHSKTEWFQGNFIYLHLHIYSECRRVYVKCVYAIKIVEKFVLLELVFYSMYSVLLNIFSRNRGIYFLHSCLNSSFLCSEGICSSRLTVRLRWLYVNVQNIDLPSIFFLV